MAGKFSRQAFGSSPTAELAQYFGFALPLDAAAIVFWESRSEAAAMDWLLPLYVLTGTFHSDGVPALAMVVADNWKAIAASYLALLVAAYVIGSILRRVVWTFRLDLLFHPLRMKPDWYYLLQGRLRGVPRRVLPYADILVSLPKGSRLYRGLVNSFSVRSGGELQELILQNAERGKGRGDAFRWVEIPGNQLILLGSNIHSINMRYFAYESESEMAASARARAWVRMVARSFLLEEP